MRTTVKVLTWIRWLRFGPLKGLGPLWALGTYVIRPSFAFYKSLLFSWKRHRYVPSPSAPTQIHLSWVEDPASSLTVTWHTSSMNNPGLVEYRKVGTVSWQGAHGTTVASPGIGGGLHRATIRDLRPDTRYEYRVSSDATATPPMSTGAITRTAPAKGSADFSFAFICDVGIIGRRDSLTNIASQMIDEVLKDEPLFVLGGGDYAYAAKDNRFATTAQAIDAWFDQMEPLFCRVPFMAQYGNHEIYHDESFQDWGPRFAHPPGFDRGKNYSFEVGDVHFTGLLVPGSRHCPGPSAQQLAWLDADLGDARRRGIRWLVVFQHDAIFAHGDQHPARPEVRAALAPIFEKHRVDLHFSGHDQNFERTYPLKGLPHHPMVVNSSQNSYGAGAGVIYAKVSPSGKVAGPEFEQGSDSIFEKFYSNFTVEQQDFMAVRDNTCNHYAYITVRAAGRIHVTVYGLKGEGTPKTRVDSFEIVAPESQCADTDSAVKAAG
ncbi:MAG TPA: metallophosphoesterase family protein [Rhodothermales bacterium]